MGLSIVLKTVAVFAGISGIVAAHEHPAPLNLQYEHEGSLFNSVAATSCCVHGVVHEGDNFPKATME
jgi:hypothetical protein